MLHDPIVEEVRKARDEYGKRFNHDLDAICRDLQMKQQARDKKSSLFSTETCAASNCDAKVTVTAQPCRRQTQGGGMREEKELP